MPVIDRKDMRMGSRPGLPAGSLTSFELLQAMGFSKSRISRFARSGALVPEPQARGIFRIAGRELSPHHQLMVVALYAPRTTLCLFTALQLLELRGPSPDIWLCVPASGRVPNLELLPLALIRPRAGPADEDVRVKVVDGVRLQHTSAARTVTDCFQFRARVGIDVAVSALHAVRKAGVASMDDIWRCAEGAGVAEVMLPYLEAID